MKKIKCRINILIFALVLLLGSFSFCFAAGAEYTVSFTTADGPLAGAVFHMYHIASMDSKGSIKPDAEYSTLLEHCNLKDTSGWPAVSGMLEAYIKTDSIVADQTAVTDKNGVAKFNKQDGLYLITGELKEVGSRWYAPQPFLVHLTAKSGSSTSKAKYLKGEDDPPIVVPPYEPEEPDNPEPGNPTPIQEPAPEPGLPQTGQLWWPVPVLVLSGLTMLGLGKATGRRRSGHHV